MTKELHFDVHFASAGAQAVSGRGAEFLYFRQGWHPRDIYVAAASSGLHIRFETAEIRDALASQNLHL